MISNPQGFFKVFPRSQVAEFMANFDAAEIKADLTTTSRKAWFLANVVVETGGFTSFREKTVYKANRLPYVWPNRFSITAWDAVKKKYVYSYKPNAAAYKYAGDGPALANFVYADRMGNGPESSGDGYHFRGGGGLQATGREMYEWLDDHFHLNGKLLALPDMLKQPNWALESAVAIWIRKNCNPDADKDNAAAVRKRINGGSIGLDEVIKAYYRILPFI